MKLKIYIKHSIKKFKNDAMSKLIYDILKWLIIAILVFTASHLLPKGSFLGEFLQTKKSITIYWIVLYSLIMIIIIILLLNLTYKHKIKKVELDNFTDELTGLKNHKALKKYLTEELEKLNDSTHTLSIILIDVDDFKDFNTNYGYNTADKILKSLGNLLENDKRVTDATFRLFLRGDEFMVIAKDTTLNNAYLAAERKRKLIENTCFTIDDNKYYLKVSCGVTEYKKEIDSFETITERAMSALNEAKKQENKNCTKTNF